MKIGTTLNLTIQDPNTNEIFKYRSKIIDKNEKYLFIDYPVNIKTEKTGFFPIGTKFAAYYLSKNNDQMYKFRSEERRVGKYGKVMKQRVHMIIINRQY